MRKTTTLKTLLRSPAKTVLTFLLVAAASFTLFSRVTDYAVTTREAAKAESFYNGVAALDNTQPLIVIDEEIDGVSWGRAYMPENKPWPDKEQIEEFSSLPGVTLADTRYMTAGQVEDYKRIKDKTDYSRLEDFVVEGTYVGYEEDSAGTNYIDILFQDVTVHAGEIDAESDKPLKVTALALENRPEGKNPHSKEFFDELEKGSRCLVVGMYEAGPLVLGSQEEDLRVIDGLGDDYLETEEFAVQREEIERINKEEYVFDIVYTEDMRAIPRFNERTMVISEGRPVTSGDTDVCVVCEDVMEEYGLSLGDTLHIELGDILLPQNGSSGAVGKGAGIPNYIDTAELEIIGVYHNMDEFSQRLDEFEWSYTVNTIFVPSSLLPVEVAEDHEPNCGEFSVFIENARDIETFRKAAEPLVAEMGLGMRFSDGGWTSMKDSFQTGAAASILTTVLYVAGAALSLLLAVYLYIGRNKKAYAIMRTLGVSGKKAGNSVALPFVVLSIIAMPAGGMAGLFYASYTAAQTLAGLADSSAPEGYVYVLDATLPVGVVVLCMVFELAFASFVTLLFLWKMKKVSPLELLQEGNPQRAAGKKAESYIADTAPNMAAFDIAGISNFDEALPRGKYGALGQVTAYILRHMRRGFGKTAVSLILAVVLTAGIGMLVLARLSYHEAYDTMEVKGRAMDFVSTSIDRLATSDLVKDFYCYSNFNVRTNGMDTHTPMIATNDLEHYLTNNSTITYAEGYDSSFFELTGEGCLLGETLAEMLGVRAGDEIALISDNWYSVVQQVYEDKGEELLTKAIERETTMFKVIGIVKSGDTDVSTSIFTGTKNGVDRVFGQPFPFNYGEFTLADNDRVEDLNALLEELQRESQQTYAPMAFFHIDSESLENVERIRDLLVSLFPIAVAAAVLIGLFGPGLVVIQSAQEAAFLRILGVTKKRARCMLVFQQVILCVVGIVLVAGVLSLSDPKMFAKSTQTLVSCWALYFAGCVCGTVAAAVQITRRKVLELLQVKE